MNIIWLLVILALSAVGGTIDAAISDRIHTTKQSASGITSAESDTSFLADMVDII